MKENVSNFALYRISVSEDEWASLTFNFEKMIIEGIVTGVERRMRPKIHMAHTKTLAAVPISKASLTQPRSIWQ